MELTTLTAISSIDGRYRQKVEEIQDYFSEYALIRNRLIVEIKWFKTLALCPDIKQFTISEQKHFKALDDIINNFDLNDAQKIKDIEKKTNHDVKAVEYFIKQKLEQIGLAEHSEFVHFACTSEDINNLAYALSVKECRSAIIKPLMTELIENMTSFAAQYADVPMLARTHGQPASPTTVGKEFANVSYRLQRQQELFMQVPIFGKINGAVGNYNAHCVAYPDIDWQIIAQDVVGSLGLEWNPYTTQIEPHDYLAEMFHSLIRFNTIMIDFCRDTWGYISLGYFTQKLTAGETGSSTMPHKVNPIDFENAEGNFGMANALFSHLSEKLPVSRWQRDLTDSTVLRNIGSAIALTVIAYKSTLKGMSKLRLNADRINQDIENAWEVLAEPIQTVMRKHKIDNAYEKLKDLTRGQAITQASLQTFIMQLELPQYEKDNLLALSPSSYTGIASKLAKSL